jgi:hypothetical protein
MTCACLLWQPSQDVMAACQTHMREFFCLPYPGTAMPSGKPMQRVVHIFVCAFPIMVAGVGGSNVVSGVLVGTHQHDKRLRGGRMS